MFTSTIYAAAATLVATLAAVGDAHLFMTYPGWRGDNLDTNGTTEMTDGLAAYELGNGSTLYPYGMQWLYPCGGMRTSTNRTKWPVTGGAVGFQPGWFTGHLNGVVYVNLGEGTSPKNMSLPMLGATGIIGPTNEAYPGMGVCFPQLPLPVNYTANIGDNATIQVVLLAQHGAALYSCVDITFADPSEVAEVNSSNCWNSTNVTDPSAGIRFTEIYATTSLTSAAVPLAGLPSYAAWVPMAAALAGALLW